MIASSSPTFASSGLGPAGLEHHLVGLRAPSCFSPCPVCLLPGLGWRTLPLLLVCDARSNRKSALFAFLQHLPLRAGLTPLWAAAPNPKRVQVEVVDTLLLIDRDPCLSLVLALLLLNQLSRRHLRHALLVSSASSNGGPKPAACVLVPRVLSHCTTVPLLLLL